MPSRRPSISGLDVFLAVARHGSLRAAAAELGIRPSAVSQRLKALETQIGVALFARTTRSVRLTDVGEGLLARVDPAMSELRDALEDARDLANSPSGILRLTLPEVAFRLVFEADLPAFLAAFPHITIELSIDDGFVDVISGGFHAGVRRGHQVHEDMIGIPLTPPLREAFFASPEYLERNGRPTAPSDLKKHRCIAYRYIASKRLEQWSFKEGDDIIDLNIQGPIIVNNTKVLIDAARHGIGIASFYKDAIHNYVSRGELEAILDSYCIEHPGFYLYYPQHHRNLRKLRVLIEWFGMQKGNRLKNSLQRPG